MINAKKYAGQIIFSVFYCSLSPWTCVHGSTQDLKLTQQGFASQRPQGTTAHKVIEGTGTLHAHTHTVIKNPHNHQKHTDVHNTLASTEYSVLERTSYTKPSHTRPWPTAITHCVAWGGCIICDVRIILDACAWRGGFAGIAAHT